MGCYNDHQDRDMPYAMNDWTSKTIEQCIQGCSRAGYLYSANQFSLEIKTNSSFLRMRLINLILFFNQNLKGLNAGVVMVLAGGELHSK